MKIRLTQQVHLVPKNTVLRVLKELTTFNDNTYYTVYYESNTYHIFWNECEVLADDDPTPVWYQGMDHDNEVIW